jgi:hypothetical protein
LALDNSFLFSFCSIESFKEGVMVYTFDSLGYAKRLRENGVPQNQAEAHAEAARDFIMAELATKADLLAVRTDLRTELAAVRADLLAVKQELESRIDTQTLRLTVRFGAMQVVLIGVLATLLKLA